MTSAEAAVLPGTERIKEPCKGGADLSVCVFRGNQPASVLGTLGSVSQ